ncbi:AAA family ATPase [Candidatus Gracilibacteria bacterium]|nr:AAA family ATPase [Candidatus Gracilibacteria bacterium]
MKITLFGLAGSGTTTIAKMLCEKLDYTFMSTGNIFREYAKNAGMDLYEFENTIAKKDLNFDIKLDDEVKIYGENNDNFIFESRLAWNFIPDSFKIYLDCEQAERYKRIQEREQGKLEDIIFFNTRREQELKVRYQEIYPHITFPPKKEIFDIYIDGTHKNPDEILAIILEKMKLGSSIS